MLNDLKLVAVTKDGRELPVQIAAAPLKSAAGGPDFVLWLKRL